MLISQQSCALCNLTNSFITSQQTASFVPGDMDSHTSSRSNIKSQAAVARFKPMFPEFTLACNRIAARIHLMEQCSLHTVTTNAVGTIARSKTLLGRGSEQQDYKGSDKSVKEANGFDC